MACGPAVFGLQDVNDLLSAPMAPADVNQGPDDDPNHVMKKTLALDVNMNRMLIAVLADITTRD